MKMTPEQFESLLDMMEKVAKYKSNEFDESRSYRSDLFDQMQDAIDKARKLLVEDASK